MLWTSGLAMVLGLHDGRRLEAMCTTSEQGWSFCQEHSPVPGRARHDPRVEVEEDLLGESPTAGRRRDGERAFHDANCLGSGLSAGAARAGSQLCGAPELRPRVCSSSGSQHAAEPGGHRELTETSQTPGGRLQVPNRPPFFS